MISSRITFGTGVKLSFSLSLTLSAPTFQNFFPQRFILLIAAASYRINNGRPAYVTLDKLNDRPGSGLTVLGLCEIGLHTVSPLARVDFADRAGFFCPSWASKIFD
jgi:hypothetical protein